MAKYLAEAMFALEVSYEISPNEAGLATSVQLVADSVQEDAIMSIIAAGQWDTYAKLQDDDSFASKQLARYAFVKAAIDAGTLKPVRTTAGVTANQFKDCPLASVRERLPDRGAWKFIGGYTLAKPGNLDIYAWQDKVTHRVMISKRVDRLQEARRRLVCALKANPVLEDDYDPDEVIGPAEDRLPDDWEPLGETSDSGNWDRCLQDADQDADDLVRFPGWAPEVIRYAPLGAS